MILDLHAASPIAFGVHLAIIEEPIAAPDDVASRIGLHEIGDAWRNVTRGSAGDALRFILSNDMVFSAPRLVPSVVEDIISDFMERFSLEARFYTNGAWHEGIRRGRNSSTVFGPDWHPATQATIDGGIVAIDATRAGVLWIEDED